MRVLERDLRREKHNTLAGKLCKNRKGQLMIAILHTNSTPEPNALDQQILSWNSKLLLRAERPGVARVPASEPSTYGQEYPQAPAVQPASTSAFYQQQHGTSLLPTDTSRSEHTTSYGPSAPSEGAYSEEEYEIDAEGQFVRDARGNKIRYQNPVSDEEAYEYRCVRTT